SEELPTTTRYELHLSITRSQISTTMPAHSATKLPPSRPRSQISQTRSTTFRRSTLNSTRPLFNSNRSKSNLQQQMLNSSRWKLNSPTKSAKSNRQNHHSALNLARSVHNWH